MNEKYLTKIEINLPVKIKPIRILSKILSIFINTEGIGGCTYSTPSKPPIFKGIWFNPETKTKIEDDIICIYGCYDIQKANIEAEDLINKIKRIIETEGGEKLAWITYSNVCIMEKLSRRKS